MLFADFAFFCISATKIFENNVFMGVAFQREEGYILMNSEGMFFFKEEGQFPGKAFFLKKLKEDKDKI